MVGEVSHDQPRDHSVEIRGSRADGPREEPHTEVDRQWITLRTSVWMCTRTRSRWRSCVPTRTSPSSGSSRKHARPFWGWWPADAEPIACYEAGPTGYETHRLLSSLGVRRHRSNLGPPDWQARG